MNECRVWSKYRDAEGYGRVWDRMAKKLKYVHRLEWERHHGVVLTRYDVIHHTCQEPACYAIEHLVHTTRWEHRRAFHRGGGPACEHGVAPRCPSCQLAVNRENMRRWRARRDAVEGCHLCLKPAFATSRLCRAHLDAANRYQRQRRADRKVASMPP